MTIHLTCESCQAGLKVPDKFAGKTGKCPKCGAALPIPAADAPASDRPDAPEPIDAPEPNPLAENPPDHDPSAFAVPFDGLDLGASVGLSADALAALDAGDGDASDPESSDAGSDASSAEKGRGRAEKAGKRRGGRAGKRGRRR